MFIVVLFGADIRGDAAGISVTAYPYEKASLRHQGKEACTLNDGVWCALSGYGTTVTLSKSPPRS